MGLETIWWPLLLSTFAGLSTSIGAVLAVTHTPDEAMLAFLLGTAIGVMSMVSCVELWWHKAVQHSNWLGVTAAVAAGAVVFALLDPLLPKPSEPQLSADHDDHDMSDKSDDLAKVEPHAVLYLGPEPHMRLSSGTKVEKPGLVQLLATSRGNSAANSPRHAAALHTSLPGSNSSNSSSSNSNQHEPTVQRFGSGRDSSFTGHPRHGSTSSDRDLHHPLVPMRSSSCSSSRHSDRPGAGDSGVPVGSSLVELRAHHAGLMRLGLLMAVTMTMHNLPEGFAVAFSAFTGFGKLMALAIAVHNIPEGLIIAVPIYAATNSKLRAIGLAAASGLSEPVGALIALFVFKPFVGTLEQLDYVLAFVGGVMLAVCGLELWPEGRKCRQDAKLAQGIVLGAVVMGWTLTVGV